MFVFRKIWCALFSCKTRSEIGLLALFLMTCKKKWFKGLWVVVQRVVGRLVQ